MTSAADYWSALQARGYAPNWYSFCAEEINRRVTGSPQLAPTMWALTQRAMRRPARHLLEIGCLSGRKLFNLVSAGFAERASGVDIAANAIEVGKRDFGSVVELAVADLNAPDLPPSAFDVALANGVLHHLENLERCAQSLYESIEPGGILCASEFTGPQRYRYSGKEISLINQGVMLLPPDLRTMFDPSSLAPKLAADPSESVRTRDIEAVLRATFDEVEAIPFGGNVLMRALSPVFFSAFRAEKSEHVAALERLVAFDAEVSAREPGHHHYFVARRAIRRTSIL